MTGVPTLGRAHARRLRALYRSAGWPSQDIIEIELLVAGMAERVSVPGQPDLLRVTDAGLAFIAQQATRNRAGMSSHEALVERVAALVVREGRIAWRGLSLRAQIPGDLPTQSAWCVARPDVFSIRNTTVETYVEPVVHEIKVTRADLLGDLKRPAKRAAYQDLGACWYVLGQNSKGESIGDPSEIPPECGVMLAEGDALRVVRRAEPARRQALPFAVWMALAKATSIHIGEDDAQGLLGA